MPATVISLINLKGGVAKTTTTVQLAECLVSEFGKKVLVIDLDPQTNSTISLISEEKWEELKDNHSTLFDLFNDKLEKQSTFELSKAIQRGVSNLRLPKLDLLASSIQFIDIQDSLGDIPKNVHHTINPMEVLKSCIHRELENYDYVLIDCPPNLGYITKNGIEISDYYLIPTIPDTLSTYGIPQIVKTIHDIASSRALKIRCLGLVITKFSSTSSAHRRGLESLPSRFAQIFSNLGLPPAPVFQTIMPQANATAESMEFGNKVTTFRGKYGPGQSGGQAIYQYVIDLAKELMGHVGG